MLKEKIRADIKERLPATPNYASLNRKGRRMAINVTMYNLSHARKWRMEKAKELDKKAKQTALKARIEVKRKKKDAK